MTAVANPRLKAIKKLATSNSAYKKMGEFYLEGEHLCEAYCAAASGAGVNPQDVGQVRCVVGSQSAWRRWAPRVAALRTRAADFEAMVLADRAMMQWSSLTITQAERGIGFVVAVPQRPQVASTLAFGRMVLLDRIQDSGNVGSILRSCAAFGVQQVVALQGTASLWSPKVLRAAMGAHFALQLHEDVAEHEVNAKNLIVTNSHQGEFLHIMQAADTFAANGVWVFGHEGQGVSPTLRARATQQVRVAQLSQESLNVAAAAAICLYAHSCAIARAQQASAA